MIRVGRRLYTGSSYVDPKYDGFTPIVSLTKSTAYGDLGPYVLKNDKGQIMENLYQFSRLREFVPYSKQFYSRFDKTVIWSHPHEIHYHNGEPTAEYWNWREKGFNNPYPVRYPVGYSAHKSNCIGALHQESEYVYRLLNYIDARKKIYAPTYCSLVHTQPNFLKLKDRLRQGENLLIIEVDGPHQESLPYYKEKYGVNDNFIEDNTTLIDRQAVNIFLNDEKHSFGHGYCLASALLEKEDWLQ